MVKLGVRALSFIVLVGLACNFTANSQPAIATETPHPSPEPERTPAVTITPVPEYFTNATVFASDPYVPILIFHQFAADRAPYSTESKVRFSDFQNELLELNEAGFTLIPVQSWLRGDFYVPAGRRPLIFTMDDLFFNNQLTLLPDGNPDPNTGIGILWYYSQLHPEFGFSIGLFANLGDKLYADPTYPDWKMKLAKAIVWGIEHDAMPYNHTYTHVRLDKTEASEIKQELRRNDLFLRELLNLAGRGDLLAEIPNYMALPYGVWPWDRKTLTLYQNPEGLPMEAIFEADFHAGDLNRPVETLFVPPPYDSSFNRYQVPRITASLPVIEWLVESKENVPEAGSCVLGPVQTEETLKDPTALSSLIKDAITNERCISGIYFINGFTFRADVSQVSLIFTKR